LTAFDGCEIERGRVFFSDCIGGIGRTSAKLTVNSHLVLLNIDMLRNLYQSTRLQNLYDSGCTLVKNAFGTNGTAGAGSKASIINWSGADPAYQQGSITFTSAVNTGVTTNVNTAEAGVSLTLG
jgi:hypothetical protein